MKILHVTTDLSAGGAELMLQRLVEANIAKPEIQHHVVSLQGMGRIGPELRAKGVPVIALNMRGPIDAPKVVIRLVRLIRQLRPDVVHNWMYHANLLGGMAARIAGKSAVIWAIRATSFDETMGVSKMTTWLRRISARFSTWLPDAIVYVAHAARRAHHEIGYDSSKGTVIPNGYYLPAPLDLRTAREALGLATAGIIVGSVGRFNAAKDPRNFVHAAALVVQKCPATRFLMVGRGLSSNNRELMDCIAEQGLENHILLLGERSDVHQCFAALDIFCLHSATEAFPNVLAEAMAASVACVATDVGDAACILGDAGLVVPARNSNAMAEALIAMIKAGPVKRGAYGQHGRERIATSYSIGAVVDRYAALYCQLVGDAGHHPAPDNGATF